MRALMTTMAALALAVNMSACGQPDAAVPIENLPERHDLDADLGYITVVDGHLSGEFDGRSFDTRPSVIRGHSSPENSQVELIYEFEDEQAVMALNSFTGDIVAWEDPSPSARGCSGPAINRWFNDAQPTNSSFDLVQDEAGAFQVDFRLEFESGEWMEGNYVFRPND